MYKILIWRMTTIQNLILFLICLFVFVFAMARSGFFFSYPFPFLILSPFIQTTICSLNPKKLGVHYGSSLEMGR